MALIVETGSIIANADTFISLVDAEAYIAAKVAPSEWTAASDIAKESALRVGTIIVNSRYRYAGKLVNPTTQPLNWPRYDAYDSEERFYDSETIPKIIKDAVCEFALIHIRDGDLTEPDDEEVKKVKLDVMEIENFTRDDGGSSQPNYRFIDEMIRPLLANKGGSKIGHLERGM